MGRHVLAVERSEIVQQLRDGAFDALEDRFASLRANLRSDIRWEDQLADSYLAFAGPDDDVVDRLDEWVALHRQGSSTPYAARAWFWWARAEEWDRERTRRGDDADVMAARDACYRQGVADARHAIALDPDDLGGHLARVRLDGIYRMSEGSLDLIQATVRRFPYSYRVRREALWRVRPVSGGSYETMQLIVDEAQSRVDANPRLAELRGFVPMTEAARLRELRDYAGALKKLDEAEALGAPPWSHHERALTWSFAADPVRALAEANLAVAGEPGAWQVLDVRARILWWIATFSTLTQSESILGQALADQDDALALQPGSYRGQEQRARIASFHADCVHSLLRCFSHATVGLEDEGAADVADPESWWVRILMFVVGIPITVLLLLIEGDRLYLLPVPLAALGAIAWNGIEWRRHRYWVPRIIHVMAVLAFLTIVAINVAWVRAGGSMWVQRYVVIVVCAIVPYVIYLTLGGPRYMAKRGRVPDYPFKVVATSTMEGDGGRTADGTASRTRTPNGGPPVP